MCGLLQADEDLDPEDVELDENNTLETRSKCKSFSYNTNLYIAKTMNAKEHSGLYL